MFRSVTMYVCVQVGDCMCLCVQVSDSMGVGVQVSDCMGVGVQVSDCMGVGVQVSVSACLIQYCEFEQVYSGVWWLCVLGTCCRKRRKRTHATTAVWTPLSCTSPAWVLSAVDAISTGGMHMCMHTHAPPPLPRHTHVHSGICTHGGMCMCAHKHTLCM